MLPVTLLRRLRQVDVKAEHFERQLQRAEQERDQWESKCEVRLVNHPSRCPFQPLNILRLLLADPLGCRSQMARIPEGTRLARCQHAGYLGYTLTPRFRHFISRISLQHSSLLLFVDHFHYNQVLIHGLSLKSVVLYPRHTVLNIRNEFKESFYSA